MKHGSKAGKDTVGHLHLNYIGITPLYDEDGMIGTQVYQVVSIDYRGSMPDWLRNKMAKKMSKNIVNMAKMMQQDAKKEIKTSPSKIKQQELKEHL